MAGLTREKYHATLRQVCGSAIHRPPESLDWQIIQWLWTLTTTSTLQAMKVPGTDYVGKWHRVLAPKPLSHNAGHQAAWPWVQLDFQEPAASFPAQAPATPGCKVLRCLPEAGTLRLAIEPLQ